MVVALSVNQVLCSIYILRVHNGDPSFIADFLPAGWFDLADANRLLRAIAATWPAPEALEITVLRVPALLELPFVILAYVTVLWWVDPHLCRIVLRSPLIWLASVAYSATFCVVELALLNPYTVSDLVMRGASALLTPLAVQHVGHVHGSSTAFSVRRFVGLLVSVGALGFLILVFYDTVLLYNLAHLPSWLSGGGAALAVLGASHLSARRSAQSPAGPTAAALIVSMRRFLVLFFVPALAIRYTLGFGSVRVGLGATIVAGSVALGGGIRETAAGLALSGRALTVRVVTCLIAGAMAGLPALRFSSTYPEQTLLLAATLFGVGALGTAVLLDRAVAQGDHRSGDGEQRPGARDATQFVLAPVDERHA